MINKDFENNTVSAVNQVAEKFKVYDGDKGGIRVLFLGNSITLHETKPEIGWLNNWGMAASKKESDYVHRVLKSLKERFGGVNYCIVNVGKWEKYFWKDEVIDDFYEAKEFGADVVIFRFGENVTMNDFDNHDFKKHYQKIVEYFSNGAKRLVFTNLFWEVSKIDQVIKSVCDNMGGKFVSLTDLGYDDSNKAIGLFEHEGVASHPGDLGMEKIADRISAAII